MNCAFRAGPLPEPEHDPRAAYVPRPLTLQPGTILATPVGALRLLVLAGNAEPQVVECDGVALGFGSPAPCSMSVGADSRGVELVRGGRYRDDETGIELRCLVPGGRNITVDGRAMHLCESDAARTWRWASSA